MTRVLCLPGILVGARYSVHNHSTLSSRYSHRRDYGLRVRSGGQVMRYSSVNLKKWGESYGCNSGIHVASKEQRSAHYLTQDWAARHNWIQVRWKDKNSLTRWCCLTANRVRSTGRWSDFFVLRRGTGKQRKRPGRHCTTGLGHFPLNSKPKKISRSRTMAAGIKRLPSRLSYSGYIEEF
jgi:hypothetical protein